MWHLQFWMWISLRWIREGTEKLHEIWMFLSFLFWKNFCIRIQNDKIWQILGHWDIQDNGSVVDLCSIHSLIFFAALLPKTGNVFWLGLGLFESSLTNGRITPNAHALAELAKKNRTGRAFSSLASGVMRRPASAYDGTVRFLLTQLPIEIFPLHCIVVAHADKLMSSWGFDGFDLVWVTYAEYYWWSRSNLSSSCLPLISLTQPCRTQGWNSCLLPISHLL